MHLVLSIIDGCCQLIYGINQPIILPLWVDQPNNIINSPMSVLEIPYAFSMTCIQAQYGMVAPCCDMWSIGVIITSLCHTPEEKQKVQKCITIYSTSKKISLDKNFAELINPPILELQKCFVE